MSRAGRAGGAVLALVLGAASATAEEPLNLRAGELITRPVANGLADEIASLREATERPAWVVWAVDAIPDRGDACCFSGIGSVRSTGCRLESRDRSWGRVSGDEFPAEDDRQRVLVRLADGRVDRVEAYSASCPLDAGELTVHELQSIDPDESVELLAEWVLGDSMKDRVREGALMAIAGHLTPRADQLMLRFTRSSMSSELRERTAFWFGAARGEAGYAPLERLLRTDPDGDVREQVSFALSLSSAADAPDLLLETARRNSDPDLRGKALFWLAQKAGDKVVETLSRAVRDDPDAEVREQAVFAVSQLPRDEGIPLLIRLARTNPHPEVRQRALFWLGQSGDPRALDLIEEILTN